MYKRIALFNFGKKEKERLFATELVSAARERAIESVEVHTAELCIEVGGESAKPTLIQNGKEFDVNDSTYHIFRLASRRPLISILAWLMQKRGIDYMDEVNIHHDELADKAFQIVALAEEGLPVPHSCIFSAEFLENQIGAIEARFSYPFVLKARGAQGRSVWVVRDREECLAAGRAVEDQKELLTIQEIIENTYDIRALIFQGKVLGAMRRTGDGFLNNISCGAEATRETLSPEEEHMCINATRVVGVDFAGVDFIRTGTGISFLEVNKSPQLGGIRKVTGGLNVGAALLDTICAHKMKKARNKESAISTLMLEKAAAMGITGTRFGRATFVLSDGAERIKFVDTMPDSNSAVSSVICKHKYICNTLLRQSGIEVPESTVFTNKAEAVDFLQRHKKIVVKPLSGMHGRGITMNITTKKELLQALEHAKAHDKKGAVLLETQVTGSDHRLLVIAKKQVVAFKKVPPTVVGDGLQSVQELIQQENKRRATEQSYCKEIQVTPDVHNHLALQSHDIYSVPQAGEVVQLSQIANISQGATTIDVTGTIAQKHKETAIKAAEVLGMDVVGIDMLSEDLTQNEEKGLVLEANNYPGIMAHVYPTIGDGHDVATMIIKALFGRVE